MRTRDKLRVMVLTDISTMRTDWLEPDDTQSMVRFLLYANEFEIEGLVATAYGKHGAHPEYLETLVHAYGEVLPNLRLHDPEYPSAEQLHSVVRCGSMECGMEHMGEGCDTDGSERIIEAADREDDRPLWILLWGGPLDLAQALWKVSHTRTAEETAAFIRKLRVYAILDQYDETGPWIKENFPELFYITAYRAFRGMYRSQEEGLAGKEWVEAHVVSGMGALADRYPVYDGGDPWGRVRGMKEGDSPSFLYLIPNGLGDPERPELGSWGGRFMKQETDMDMKARQFVDAEDPVITAENADQDRCKSFTAVEQGMFATVARWRAAYQSDFAARLEWCVKPPSECCHPPVVVLKQKKLRMEIRLRSPGRIIRWKATV